MRDDEVRGEEEEENGIHGVHFRGKWSQRKVEVGKEVRSGRMEPAEAARIPKEIREGRQPVGDPVGVWPSI